MTKHTPATPLPWRQVENLINGTAPDITGLNPEIDIICRMYGGHYQTVEINTNYLIHTANAYPKLVAEVKRLQAVIQYAVNQLDTKPVKEPHVAGDLSVNRAVSQNVLDKLGEGE